MSAPRLLWLLAASAVAACVPEEPVVGAPAAAVADGIVSARFGEEARSGALRIVPLRIEEDSRCPFNVQCVHAGTVRLAVRASGPAGERQAVLRLDEPHQLWPGVWIRLAAVCPHPRFPGPIAREAYRFTFTVASGMAPPPLDFACPRTP